MRRGKKMKDSIELIENKLKRLNLPFDPVVQRIVSANDWVQSLKVCIEELSKGLDRFSSSPIQEGLGDDFIEKSQDRLFEISSLFQRVFRQYLSILKKRYQASTPEVQSRVRDEMVDHWRKLAVSLESAKSTAREIEGRAKMLNVWDDERFSGARKFIERIKSSSVGDVQQRMKNAEFPLGDDMVSYDDE
jgi:hypothetical protein